MTKQTIEVEVPEGWKVKEYRMPNKGDYFWHQNRVCVASSSFIDQRLIIEKIQPRRIVLEETEDKHLGCQTLYINDTEFMIMTDKVWREVKETDISLTNDEPNVKMGVIQGDCDDQKLELSVKELRNVRSLIKDFENLGWFINPERALLLQKITEFIKDK